MNTSSLTLSDESQEEPALEPRATLAEVVHLMANDPRIVTAKNGMPEDGLYKVEVPYNGVQEKRVIAIRNGVPSEFIPSPSIVRSSN